MCKLQTGVFWPATVPRGLVTFTEAHLFTNLLACHIICSLCCVSYRFAHSIPFILSCHPPPLPKSPISFPCYQFCLRIACWLCDFIASCSSLVLVFLPLSCFTASFVMWLTEFCVSVRGCAWSDMSLFLRLCFTRLTLSDC